MTEITEKTVSVVLDHECTINGVKYVVGGHSVHPDIAADLTRMNDNANEYQIGLSKNNPVSGNLGSVSAA